jgi:hypothetical protein
LQKGPDVDVARDDRVGDTVDEVAQLTLPREEVFRGRVFDRLAVVLAGVTVARGNDDTKPFVQVLHERVRLAVVVAKPAHRIVQFACNVS